MTDITTPRPPLTVRTPVSEHPTVAVYPDVRDPGFVVLEWRVAESVHREVLHRGDLLAALADDLDPAAVEQPTAAQVLAAHGACYGGSDEAYAVTCSCDRYGRPMGYAGFDGVKVHAAHQAAALAAAGLLVTPERTAARCCTGPVELRLEGTWLVEEHPHHTCGAGGAYGHEPGCGLAPLADLADQLAVRDREAHRTGYRTALDDVRCGSFISGPVHDALAGHDAKVAARALREWVSEWPTTPGDGTFLASVARDGLNRADRIERQEEGR